MIRFWAFVWRVFRDREELNEELGEKGYATKTRGIRKVAPARPALVTTRRIGRSPERPFRFTTRQADLCFFKGRWKPYAAYPAGACHRACRSLDSVAGYDAFSLWSAATAYALGDLLERLSPLILAVESCFQKFSRSRLTEPNL